MDKIAIAQRINQIKALIHQTEVSVAREPGSVQLLAVSKGQSIQAIEQAFAAGLRDFGENYWQEAQEKMRRLSAFPITWHFIGPLQSNKACDIARHFAWVHGVSRLKIAQQLSVSRPTSMPVLNVCLQVNFDAETNKSGIPPDDVIPLASEVLKLPRLCLRGLMMIPKPQPDEHQQYHSFMRLTGLLRTLNQQLNLSLDTLSMGMSVDMQAAIRAGSTIVRVGRAIFGERLEN